MLSLFLIPLASLLCPTTLATGFGATVAADWAGQFPYVVSLQNPVNPFELNIPGVIVSQKMAVSAAAYFNPMSVTGYVMTDVDLKVHTIAKVVGSYASVVYVFKTCLPFGAARFNLTLSEFVTFEASHADAAIIFFQGNNLMSKSTTTLTDSDCDSQLTTGASNIGSCIEKDSTAGICTSYYADNITSPTYLRLPLLVVNGRVQSFAASTNCNATTLNNDDPGFFYKTAYFRDHILAISGLVIDNP